MPMWLRDTPEHKPSEDLRKIVLWEQRATAKRSSAGSSKLLESQARLDIEHELKQIETKWERELKIESMIFSQQNHQNEEDEETPEEKIERERTDQELRAKAEQLRRKFAESINIHKKPQELKTLREIFEFKPVVVENDKETSSTLVTSKPTFRIDPSRMNQLLFIEYVCERMGELITKRTREYLAEQERADVPSVNEEREREEIIDKADSYVIKANSLFSQLGAQGSTSSVSRSGV